MKDNFKTIGLISKRLKQSVLATLSSVTKLLCESNCQIVIEEQTAKLLPSNHQHRISTYEKIGAECDLLVVIGGDGSLLHAARAAVAQQTPIIGINRGSLGFLTDIKPDEINQKLTDVLKGQYQEEQRFLLTAYTEEQNKKGEIVALNEITLISECSAKMIEFEVYVNNSFLCSQRSDGMILSTPTGSTAYSLSAGGPILTPDLNAIVMLPMFSHTLNNRPIVINADQTIKIVVADNTECQLWINADNQSRINITQEKTFYIKKLNKTLRLLHPLDYSYFSTLRSKLHWGKKLSNTEN